MNKDSYFYGTKVAPLQRYRGKINSLFHGEVTSVSNRSSVLQAAVLDMRA